MGSICGGWITLNKKKHQNGDGYLVAELIFTVYIYKKDDDDKMT